MEVYERIKLRRKELDLTADDVAEALGVSRATIYRYESAAIEKLPTSIINPLAKVLRCSPSYLMGWDDNAPAAINFSLTPLEEELLKRFRAMSTAEKNMILRSMGLPEISGHKETPSAEDC